MDSSPSHQNEQPQNMQSQPQEKHASDDEADAFLQPTFINILNELSAVTERVLLLESAQIEAETKVWPAPQTC